MHNLDFEQAIEIIVKEDPRYHANAYAFVKEGLNHTLKALKKDCSQRSTEHVSGQELLEGLRDYTLDEFGPLGKLVLCEWGITQCRDFGHIVFNLVEKGILGKNENDSIEDFGEIWSFEEAFEKPFQPADGGRTNKKPSVKHSKRITPSAGKPSSK